MKIHSLVVTALIVMYYLAVAVNHLRNAQADVAREGFSIVSVD